MWVCHPGEYALGPDMEKWEQEGEVHLQASQPRHDHIIHIVFDQGPLQPDHEIQPVGVYEIPLQHTCCQRCRIRVHHIIGRAEMDVARGCEHQENSCPEVPHNKHPGHIILVAWTRKRGSLAHPEPELPVTVPDHTTLDCLHDLFEAHRRGVVKLKECSGCSVFVQQVLPLRPQPCNSLIPVVAPASGNLGGATHGLFAGNLSDGFLCSLPQKCLQGHHADIKRIGASKRVRG